MTLTPGAYLKLRRTAARLAIGDVAARLATVPHVAEHARAEQLELIEADVQPATFSTIVALRRVFSFNLGILTILAEIQLGSTAPLPRMCRLCGCSEWDACRHNAETCSWVASDLCSSHAEFDEQAA